MKRLSAPLLAVALLAAGCSTPERSRDLGDPAVAGATLARQACSLCHGVRGVAVSPNFPNLAAQREDYLVAQLNAFRARSRLDPAGFEYMWGVSRHLTDDQIKDIAAYFSRQPPAHQPPEGAAGAIEAGRVLFTQGRPDRAVPACAGCHGPQGEGLAAFPRLAGQHADYVAKQLQSFQRSGERPQGSVMETVVHGLTPEDVAAAAAYVQTL